MRFYGLQMYADNTTLRRIVFAPSIANGADDRGFLTPAGIRIAVQMAPAFGKAFHGFVVQAATAPSYAVASMADIIVGPRWTRSILPSLALPSGKRIDNVSLETSARAALSAVDAIISADTHVVGLFGDEVLLQAMGAIMAPQHAAEIFAADLSTHAGFMLKNPRGVKPEEAELALIG